MVDAKYLSNYELQRELEKLGFSPGPILPSTRKIYEKKLKQLMVSDPCVPPVMNKTREQETEEDCAGTEELNDTIILKGNIIISTEKSKGSQKNPDFENQEWQKERAKPNLDNSDWRKIIKTLRMSSARQRYLRPCMKSHADLPDLNKTRCEIRLLLRQNQDTVVPDCKGTRRSEIWEPDPLPVGLKLAVLGIFVIVVFVYITVERKSLFA